MTLASFDLVMSLDPHWYSTIFGVYIFSGAMVGILALVVTLALAAGHFVLPFFYLLGRDVKRHRVALVAGAVWLLVFHYVDLYWLVMPSVVEGFAPHWLDLATLVAVGALFAGALGHLASRPALVPVADPRLPESLSFESV